MESRASESLLKRGSRKKRIVASDTGSIDWPQVRKLEYKNIAGDEIGSRSRIRCAPLRCRQANLKSNPSLRQRHTHTIVPRDRIIVFPPNFKLLTGKDNHDDRTECIQCKFPVLKISCSLEPLHTSPRRRVGQIAGVLNCDMMVADTRP